MCGSDYVAEVVNGVTSLQHPSGRNTPLPPISEERGDLINHPASQSQGECGGTSSCASSSGHTRPPPQPVPSMDDTDSYRVATVDACPEADDRALVSGYDETG